ncbi:universal stress protein [Mesorhizobium sp. M9A.F.Ca.ET.002.03.1.2]|uniref:universal stress protein n=1 Tax=Mesorhizobium sp. M9A.F.Ca.ET.002.03.1.2 TaxID=2493668 RepID=UPI001FE02A9A|nr:universal stress protein [Mesorhizobium sp. M9A.F.Ca.ET.002.03.1.2]
MLLVGLDDVLTAKGAFTPTLNDIAGGFEGPLCLVLNGGNADDRMPTLKAGASILVPVNGTEVARRAADFALALARPNRARVKVLYVSQGAARGDKPTSVSHRREEAVLKDIADLASRYGVPVDTAIHTHGTPDQVIISEVTKGAAIVVMGVTRRPGKDLFFGDTASAVLATCNRPVVLLASGASSAATPAMGRQPYEIEPIGSFLLTHRAGRGERRPGQCARSAAAYSHNNLKTMQKNKAKGAF